MFTISKQFAFSASHVLNGLPKGHQCGRLHGHNYVVEVELQGDELDAGTGFIVDYGELGTFKAYIDKVLDHRHLNDVLDQPTAEMLAETLFQVAADLLGRLPGAGTAWRVAAVRVHETPKTCAEYREP